MFQGSLVVWYQLSDDGNQVEDISSLINLEVSKYLGDDKVKDNDSKT